MSFANFEIISQLTIDICDLIILIENEVDFLGALSYFVFHSVQTKLLLFSLFEKSLALFLFHSPIFTSLFSFLNSPLQLQLFRRNKKFIFLYFFLNISDLSRGQCLYGIELRDVSI